MNDTQHESCFRFQLDILMKEIDLIDNTIGRLDEILLRNRNWGITLWTGLIAIIIPLIVKKFSFELFIPSCSSPAIVILAS